MAEQTKSSPDKTATDQTIQHYQIPKVRQTILRFVEEEYGWRALNGDQGWYKSAGKWKSEIPAPDDYENTASEFRSLVCHTRFLRP